MLAVASATLTAGRAQAQLPDPGLTVDRTNTALVLTDPQNDFLSPKGVTWGLVGDIAGCCGLPSERVAYLSG
jgi:hypothetical protein